MTDIHSILAKNDGTTLVDHTTAVLNFITALCDRSYKDDTHKDKDKDMLPKCQLAAVLHDIGKMTPAFQKSLKENKGNDDLNHNVVSWAFTCCNFEHEKDVQNAVLYHHVTSVASEDKDTGAVPIYNGIDEDTKDGMLRFYEYFREMLHLDKFPEYEESPSDYTEEHLLNVVKGGTNREAKRQLFIRAALTMADRTVSSSKYDNGRIIAGDTDYIDDIIEREFGAEGLHNIDLGKILCNTYNMERLRGQLDIVEETLSKYPSGKNSFIIDASAGFGKTLVGIISILKRGKKTIWCLPTREIAISTYRSVCSELEKMNLDIPVCLYYGNEMKERLNSCSDNLSDYVITVAVIDSVLSRMTNNNTGHLLYGLLCGDVIFDEYHNVVTENALFAAASLIWDIRMSMTNAYSLYLSATPLKLAFAGIKGSSEKCDDIKPPKYKGDIKINFTYSQIRDIDSDFPAIEPNSFVIANTVAQSQRIYRFLKEKRGMTNVHLYHAQFTDEDMEKKREFLFRNFGKGTPESDAVIVCTGIIGTGLDVSAKNIYDFTLTPSDTLQRVCGRASRFGEYELVNYTLCDITEDEPVLGKGNAVFIRNVFDEKVRKKFIDKLKKIDGNVLTKNELYRIVDEFNRENDTALRDFYKRQLDESQKNIKDLRLKKSRKKNAKDGVQYTSKGTTFRGLGKEIFIAVPYEGKEGAKDFALLTYDSLRVKQCEKDYDSTESRKRRMSFYKENGIYQKSWKYKCGIKDASSCNFDICVDMAYCSETPLPVSGMVYSPEFGAEKKTR